MTTSAEAIHSSFLENLRLHKFLAEILQESWRRRQLIDILKPEVDRSGYDLMLQCGEICRYVQFKTSKEGAKTSIQRISVKLAQRPGGCVIWMFQDDSAGSVGQYLFLGGGPNDNLELSDKTAKHAKANAQGVKNERPNYREVRKNQFHGPICIAGLLDKLFPGSSTTVDVATE